MRLRSVRLLALSALLCVPARAFAHLELEQPVSRYGRSVLKDPPCGRAGGTRSANVTAFRPGQQIVVRWNEYIDHPGHYRIAFDPDGDDNLADPVCLDGCDTTSPTIERNTPGVLVLADGIADSPTGGIGTATVTLPNMTCTNCTLQIIQVMYDKPPYTLPGNDNYYQCADLVLSETGELPDAGTPAADASVENPDANAPDANAPDASVAVDASSGGERPDASTGPGPNVVAQDSDVEGVACRTSGGPSSLEGWAPLALAAGFLCVQRRRRSRSELEPLA